MSASESVDLLMRVGRAQAMTAERNVYGALAIRRGRVAAVSESPDGLDGLVGANTVVVDDPGLFVYPAFHDSHNHQLPAARDFDYVSLENARSIADVVATVRERAASTPRAEWIISSRSWHETYLREARLPTARELDEATVDHPVFVQRGGHVGVANSMALRLAGVSVASEDPAAGTVVRMPDRTPTGVLIEPGALNLVRRLLPKLADAHQTELLGRQCRLYNSRGIGIVREPGLLPAELPIYEDLLARGELTTRTRVLFWAMPAATVEDSFAYIDALPSLNEPGDGRLGAWGLKMVMDGGVEGGFLCEPYANDPDFRGHAFWEAQAFERVVEHAVRRGWKVGCHAVGDCAVHRVLDAYEAVAKRHPDLEPATLTIEHAFLADSATRARVARANVAVTIQHPLLYSLGGNLVRYWGPHRTRHVMPVKAWLDDGVLVAAGSDCNVSFFDPLLSMWGLVTRGTRTVGVQGPEYRVDRYIALDLYTAAGGRLLGEADSVGTLSPAAFADVVAFRTDLLECPDDDLPSLTPAFTLVGGQPVYDPDGLFS